MQLHRPQPKLGMRTRELTHAVIVLATKQLWFRPWLDDLPAPQDRLFNEKIAVRALQYKSIPHVLLIQIQVDYQDVRCIGRLHI